MESAHDVVDLGVGWLPVGSPCVAHCDQAEPTVIHCDLHVENVLFTPTGPVLLDWQTVAWGPPAVDLARILCEALSADLRHVRRYQAQRAVSDEAVAAALDRLLAGIVSSRWFRVPGGPTPRSRALLEHGLTTWIAARDLFA